MRTLAAKWEERIRAWRESGLSAEDFAKSAGCRTKTMQWWASELDRRARATKNAPPAVPMVSVQVVTRPATREHDGDAISVIVGQARIAVRRGFDPALLREVVIALGGAR